MQNMSSSKEKLGTNGLIDKRTNGQLHGGYFIGSSCCGFNKQVNYIRLTLLLSFQSFKIPMEQVFIILWIIIVLSWCFMLRLKFINNLSCQWAVTTQKKLENMFDFVVKTRSLYYLPCFLSYFGFSKNLARVWCH